MKRVIRKRRVFAHPIARVWRAITTAESLAACLMPNDFVLELGHEFCFRTKPAPGFDGTVHCKVLAVDPPWRMKWRWSGGPIDTTVTFVLSPVDGGTELLLEQEGFDSLRAIAISVILERGFGKMMRRSLPTELARLARQDEASSDS